MIKIDLLHKLKEKKNLQLSYEQLKIVNNIDGPALTLATAGSGKTTTICCRVGNLVTRKITKPERILVLSFSNASVNDIRKRFESLFTSIIHLNEMKKIKFSTIHSFANSALRYYFNKMDNIPSIIDEKEQNSLISQIFYEINKRRPRPSEKKEILSLISYININKIKNNINISSYNLISSFGLIYKRYEQIKREQNKIDFTDMLFMCYTLLKEYKPLQNTFENKYDYILVDEAQDMSLIQYEIIKLMTSKHENLMLVADDDQSIYGFRGSNPEILKTFLSDYKNAETMYLSKNYRCTKTIVNVAKQFIEKNPNRFKKDIKPYNNKESELIIKHFKEEKNQNMFIANEIKRKYSNELQDTAILFRDSLSAIQLIYYLNKYDIPFYCNISEIKFFRHFIKNDIMAVILLAYDRTNIESLYEIYNKINLPFKDKDIKKVFDQKYKTEDTFRAFERLNAYYNKEQKNAMKNLEYQLNELSKLNPNEAIDYFLNNMNYKDYLANLSNKSGYANSIYARYIDLMRFLTKNEPSIRTFLYKIGNLQINVKNSKENKNKQAVTLSTLHSAKGLEFKNTFIISANKNIIPSIPSLTQSKNPQYNALDEERRLMYVGLTRAKENLYILSYKQPSRYITELKDIINNIKNN
ncbi:ATP-dependent helicase [Caldisalinibacter kiritimatiensis]|uniref:DNA 3'-5' helicase n=1 Tax=Caldisalinibacter kiritimatiensis TaxID=1304284 RepID=R1CCK9_9FIRM|nr:ATP-dependent helicase [Caldisalinibacter kiritimatiensis]EOD00005.1 putative ATP-dependent DNA helicase YjcD [Caldisalinibacter kiritimatiensis]